MLGIGLEHRVEVLEEQVAAQEQVIDALCAHLGIERPRPVGGISSLDDAERELVAQGKPVEAMKHHRERTGSSLVQAKRAVEG